MIQTDLTWLDGTPVHQSPRSILKAQSARAAAAGFTAFAGTELEFIVFNNTYEEAWDANYRGLTPANQYNVDYSILGTTRIEPLLRDIRNTMYAAGLTVESAKGECNFGQHEVAFRFEEVLSTADNHSVYKNTAKEIAEQHGRALTFMAKFNEREGNSCHIHLSLRGTDGGLVFWDDEKGARTPLYDHFIAGILATMREFTLLYAPNINSYKRFADGFVRADDGGLGPGQPDLLGPAGRSRPVRPAGEPVARRRREPVSGHRGDAGRRPVRGGERTAAGGRTGRQRLHLRQADGAEDAARGPRPVRGVDGGEGGVRRRRRRPLCSRGGHRTGRLRLGRHRLGVASRIREVLSSSMQCSPGPYRGALTGEGGVSTLVDPATGRTLTTLPSASLAETDRAIEAAQAAFPAWKAVSPGDRARLLRRFAAVVEEHIGELAALEVQPTPGTPSATPPGRPATSGTC